MFALYPELKNQHDGEGSFEAEMKSGEKRAAQAMNERKPGFTLPDLQLTGGAWTLMHSTKPGSGLLSWTRVSVRRNWEPRDILRRPRRWQIW